MKKFRLLLLDANVVIELFRHGIWARVIETCEVYLSRTVVPVTHNLSPLSFRLSARLAENPGDAMPNSAKPHALRSFLPCHGFRVIRDVGSVKFECGIRNAECGMNGNDNPP